MSWGGGILFGFVRGPFISFRSGTRAYAIESKDPDFPNAHLSWMIQQSPKKLWYSAWDVPDIVQKSVI